MRHVIARAFGSSLPHYGRYRGPVRVRFYRLEAPCDAFVLARTGRPGPVLGDIPEDVQNWEGELQGLGVLELTGYRNRLQNVTDNKLR